MVGYGEEDSHFVVELTYNYGIKNYVKGNEFQVCGSFCLSLQCSHTPPTIAENQCVLTGCAGAGQESQLCPENCTLARDCTLREEIPLSKIARRLFSSSW